MVSVNVSQLLLLSPGATREFDFSEALSDPDENFASTPRAILPLQVICQGLMP